MNDLPERKAECGFCYFWKRRGPVAGTCWVDGDAFSRTLEHESCRRFEWRTVVVVKIVGDDGELRDIPRN